MNATQTERVSDIRRFVIQQHDATRLHWDLRIEHEGVLRSWALPRGVPWNPKENRLAVATEDHSLDFLDHEGDDFDGQFGAGRSTQWDSGVCEVHKMEPFKVVVTLHGTRATGKYSLFSMRKSTNWLIHRMDPPIDAARRPVPFGVVPMRATAGELPDGQGLGEWIYEPFLHGVRAIVTDDTGRVVITDCTGADISIHFPEVRRIGRAIGHRELIVDGVIVPIDVVGDVSRDPDAATVAPLLHHRSGLERRLKISSDSGARNAARSAPVVFVAFDLLWVDGRPITELPWELRRRQLDDLRLHGPGWRTNEIVSRDEAFGLLDVTGVVAKRRSSTYRINAEATAVGFADWIGASTSPLAHDSQSN